MILGTRNFGRFQSVGKERSRPDEDCPMAEAVPHPTALLREQIVATALAMVEDAGLDAVTMRSLARRLGYSPASLYMHFRGKDELLRAVAADRAETLLADVSRAAAHQDAVRALEDIAARFFSFARESEAFDRLIFDETPGAPFSSAEEVHRERLYEIVSEALARAAAPTDPELRGPLAWGELRGIARLVRPSGPDPAGARKIRSREPAQLAHRWAQHWVSAG